MRMDLSREEETKMFPSKSVELVSMKAFKKKKIEKIGCRVSPMRLTDLYDNQHKTFLPIYKALFERGIKKVE